MNTLTFTSLAAYLLVLFFGAHGLGVEEKETIQRSFSFLDPSGPKRVEVDNLNGSIEVVGYEGHDIQLVVSKTVMAESGERAQAAGREVKLDISQEANTIHLYVDGPFRCKDRSVNYRGWDHYGYKVNFDFQLKVPPETSLCLKTINEGEVKVRNTAGNFDIDNVNGGAEMLEISGPGRVYALNGEVKVAFKKNPQASCYFGSLNGDVEVSFRQGFSADLRFKTFNGSVYTDFPVTYLPSSAPARESHKGKYVYKSDAFFGVRIGSGGPEMKFDAFNGDIRILNQTK